MPTASTATSNGTKDNQNSRMDTPGQKLTLPVSFGFHDFNFDDILEDGPPHSISTVSEFPRIEAFHIGSDRKALRISLELAY